MTMKFKTICNATAAQVFPQNPNAKLGVVGNIRTVEITDIPDGATEAEVLKAWRETTDMSYIYDENAEYPCHSYTFAEIGSGKIIGRKDGAK